MHLKRLVAVSLSVVMTATFFLGTTVFAAPAPKSYADVPAGVWYTGVTNKWGYLLAEGDNVNPEAQITRAEFAHAVNAVMGFPAAEAGFSDVSASTPYNKDIGALQAAGVINGMGDGTFQPNSTLKRSEAAVLIALALGIEPQGSPAYTDANVIPAWVAPYVNTLKEGGYFKGDEDGSFNPNRMLKRNEIFQALENAASNYVDHTTPVTSVISGNMMITAPNAVIRDVEVTGDIIIAPSVGNGDVTLDNVTLTGTIYVRGGGENSIKLTGNTSVARLIANKSGSGGVRVVTEGNASVSGVIVKGGNDNVLLEGKFDTVQMRSETANLTVSGEIGNLNIDGANVSVTVGANAVVGNLFASPTSVGANMSVLGKVNSVQVSAPAANIAVAATAVLNELKVAGAAVGAVVSNKGTIANVVLKAARVDVSNEGNITTMSKPEAIIVVGKAAVSVVVIAAGSVNDVY